jgi:predicted N-acetyltransferase YhbS
MVRLTGQDAPELVPFLDRAFAFAGGKSFQTFLPALYDPRDLLGQYTLALRRESRIVAAVGVFPILWHVGAAVLRVAGIGHVSCDPGHRGQGHMSRLLGAALRDLRQGPYDLAWLSGQRQRYGHYGWEVAGCTPHLDVNQDNIRHHFAALPAAHLRIEPLGADPDRERAVRALHDSQPAHCQRPGPAFAPVLRHGHHQPIIALDATGQVAAYAVLADEGARIVELVGRDAPAAVGLVRQHLGMPPHRNVRICLSPFDPPLIRAVSACAGGMGVEGGGNWQVFHWARTLDALLQARQAIEPLPDGVVTLALTGSHRAIRLRVQGAAASAEECGGPADLTLDAALAIRVLFGPLLPWQLTTLPPQAAVLNAWCPLPLYLPEQDHV